MAPRWGLWDVVIALAISAGMVTLVAALKAGYTAVTGAEPAVGLLVIVGIALPWLGLGGWPLVATAWRGNGPRIDLGLRLRWSDAGWGATAGVAALALSAIAAAVTRVFVPDLTSSAADVASELLRSSPRGVVIAFGMAVLVGAPVVEELFFRGLLFDALRKRGLGAAWTVVVTAVAFAAFHFEPTRFLVLLPTGFVLGWVRWRTGSLGSSMLAHGLVNAPGAIVLLLGGQVMTP